MCDLRRERFYGLLRGKEPLTSKVRSAVLDKTFFHRKVPFLVVFVQRIYQKDGKKGSRLQNEMSWQFASDSFTTPDIFNTRTPCGTLLWPSWLPYSTSLYLDFHLFHEKAERTQQGNLLIVAAVTNVGHVFVYMSSFQGRVQFKSTERTNSFDRPILKVSICDCNHNVHISIVLIFQIIFVKVKRTSERLLIMQKLRSQRSTLERHVSLFCAIVTTEAFSTRQCEVAEQSRVETRIEEMSRHYKSRVEQSRASGSEQKQVKGSRPQLWAGESM